MRIGINSTEYMRKSALQLFKDIHDTGFDSVNLSFESITEADYEPECFFGFPEVTDERTIDSVLRAKEKYGIRVSALKGLFNTAHPDPEVRDEGIRRFKSLCLAAKIFDTPVITVCSGTRNTQNFMGFSQDNITKEAWETMSDTMKRLADIAERTGITLALEMHLSHIVNTSESARRLLDEIGSKRFKMVYSSADLFLPGSAKQENVRHLLGRAFELFRSDIALVYAGDIMEGDGIEYCGTGDGIVDFVYIARMLRKIGYEGDVMVEKVRGEKKILDAYNHWKASLGISEMF